MASLTGSGRTGVTTGAVAAEVGATQAAVFRHFPTKAAMWNAVADHVAETLTAAWDAALAKADLPVDRIKALIGAQLGQIAVMPAMPMLLFSRDLNVENAALREAFRGQLDTFHDHLMRAVAEGQQTQDLLRDVAAANVATLLPSLVQGVAIRWALGAIFLNERPLTVTAVQPETDVALRIRGLGMVEARVGFEVGGALLSLSADA